MDSWAAIGTCRKSPDVRSSDPADTSSRSTIGREVQVLEVAVRHQLPGCLGVRPLVDNTDAVSARDTDPTETDNIRSAHEVAAYESESQPHLRTVHSSHP